MNKNKHNKLFKNKTFKDAQMLYEVTSFYCDLLINFSESLRSPTASLSGLLVGI